MWIGASLDLASNKGMPTVGAPKFTADSDLGSADLMPRNLNRRVEVVFPVRAPKLIRHLRDEVLATYLSDVVKGRRMQSNGSYVRSSHRADSEGVNSQQRLIDRAVSSSMQ
jgi:polyphosphate kinase